jgi:plasmid stabilization system protein ParE
MSTYRIAGDAMADVMAIWEYIAADSLRSADHLLADLERTFQRLADFPQSGHARPGDTADPPRRQQTLPRFRVTIIFRREGEVTVILRVAGCGRDLDAMLGTGDQ